MPEVTVRSAQSWEEVRRTAAGAGRAFDGRSAAGPFFRARTVDAPALPLENTLLLFVEGDLAGGLQVYERSAVLGGAPLTVGAIGNVFTLPAYRGEGHGSRLLEATREFLAEKGYPLSLLLTGIHEFYEGAGWRVCPSPVQVVADPPSLDANPAGEWRGFDPAADLDGVAATYREGCDREGRLLRPRSLWEGWVVDPETAVLDPGQVRRYVRDGRTVGYLVREDGEERTGCVEIGYRGENAAAFRAACWNELAAEAAAVEWHPPMPESLGAEIAGAGAEVRETPDDHCMVQVHDARALATVAGVETTAALVAHLGESDWYWSGVDAF
jgi:GNAT superfamily N-acetyltransferase